MIPSYELLVRICFEFEEISAVDGLMEFHTSFSAAFTEELGECSPERIIAPYKDDSGPFPLSIIGRFEFECRIADTDAAFTLMRERFDELATKPKVSLILNDPVSRNRIRLHPLNDLEHLLAGL